ncbi:MAG: hypothetical protein FJ387_25395 [Verrucomicrobia bacterium]|nr:hypothetical protein [Verrucomicrobiota bacterium]
MRPWRAWLPRAVRLLVRIRRRRLRRRRVRRPRRHRGRCRRVGNRRPRGRCRRRSGSLGVEVAGRSKAKRRRRW